MEFVLQIFDLLEALPTTPASSKSKSGFPPKPKGLTNAIGSFGSRISLAAMASGKSGIIKRQALSLKTEKDERYVAGLKWIRVRSRKEALAVFHLGQSDRQVFSTAQNTSSSRSHGVFEFRIVKVPSSAPACVSLIDARSTVSKW